MQNTVFCVVKCGLWEGERRLFTNLAVSTDIFNSRKRLFHLFTFSPFHLSKVQPLVVDYLHAAEYFV